MNEEKQRDDVLRREFLNLKEIDELKYIGKINLQKHNPIYSKNRFLKFNKGIEYAATFCSN